MFRTLGKQGIRTREIGDTLVHEIDPEQATFRDMRVDALGAYGRSKFENLLFLTHSSKGKRQIFSYKS